MYKKKKITKITNDLVRQCIDGLELLKWEHGIEKFHIEECFRHGLKSFNVTNLSADYEKGVIFCWDKRNVLFAMDCVSIGILKKSIISVDINIIDGVEYDKINLSDGYIQINAVK